MWWDTHSLIWFDFSLIRFNPMPVTWYPWRHRCKRWSMKISWTVVHTSVQLWYYLFCILFCFDLLWFSLLRDHIGHWHGHDWIANIQDVEAIYLESLGYNLRDATGYLTFHPFHPKSPSTTPAPQSVPQQTMPFAMTALWDPSGRLAQNELAIHT